jgi:hypothetical protein
LVSWDSDALRIPATAYAQTLWLMPSDNESILINIINQNKVI